MRKLWLIITLLIYSLTINAQSIIVNRYFNSATSDGTGDVAELVVIKDRLNIRKWIIKDYANGTSALDEGGSKMRFNDILLWENLRSGTVIVIRKLTAGELLTYTPDVDASDYIIDVAINDTRYFTDLAPSLNWNLTVHEAILIRADVANSPTVNGANLAVHALGYGDFMSRTTWNGISSPKAIFSNGQFDAINYVGNGTVGMVTLTNPNQANYTTTLTNSNPLISTLPSYWVKQTSLTTNMPYGIEIYRSTTDYSFNAGPTRKMNAYCLIIDPKYVDFKPTFNNPNKLPAAFVTDEPGTVLACMNAGFFQSPSGSFSILKYNGTTSANNVAILNRTFNSVTTPYYPTRVAFGLAPNLTPDVAWIYNVSGVVYSYGTPSPNELNVAPQPIPTTAGGIIWNNVTAVGGSPMLIKNSVINITDKEELIVIDNASARARTAIGHTADGKIVMLVAEGGNTGISDGLNLVELANYMKDIGCVGAINLDGGSSSALRIGSQAVIRPSSGGVEQPMPGVILIKAKN